MHRCPNRACPSRGLETLNNWVMAAADIEGVGEQLVGRLWELGLLRSLPDLYRLTKEQLLELDGFQETSATNVIDAIAARARCRSGACCSASTSPTSAGSPAQALARHFGTIERLGAASQEEIMACEGLGPERAEAIVEWFADEANKALVAELLAAPGRAGGGARAGGTPDRQHVRDHRHARVAARARRRARRSRRSAPRSPAPSPRRRRALIVGEEPGGSKVRGAEKHGTPVLDEADLNALLGG